MPYAHDGRVSTSPIEGGVEITQEEYRAAIDGMIAGQVVTIDGGFAVIDPPPPPEPEPQPDPEPEPVTRIERRQGLVALALIGELMPGIAQIDGVPIDAIDEDDIEAMLDAIPDKRTRAIARAEFRHTHWLIDSDWIDQGCDHFGIPREAKQALFEHAATL